MVDAVLPELRKFIPPWHIEIQRMSPTPYFKMKNGSEILVYASDDQQALRSLNLTGFYIEEASGVAYEIFDQLMTRLRNKAAIKRDEEGNEIGYDHLGIVCTNPEDGWIKDKFLLCSAKIVASESVNLERYRSLMKKKLEKHFHSFISSTRDNKYLPHEYIERISAGKDAKWIEKYIDCYLGDREGAVYSDYNLYTVEPFEIPRNWLRIGGFDPGFSDPTAIPLGAIDPKDGCTYVYTDYDVREKPVSYHAKQLVDMTRGLNFLYPIQGDPSIRKRNDRDGSTYADYMYRLSKVYIEEGNNDLLYGIEKVRDYMYSGKLKFFNNLYNLKDESENYIYVKREGNSNDKPRDSNNHLWDAIRYMIAKLPRNPLDMEQVYEQHKELNKTEIFKGAPIRENDDDDGVYGGFKIDGRR